jgi:hypothetical protein
MDIAPLNPKYKLKLGKVYGVGGGNRFRVVEVIEKETGKPLKRIDVKTREGHKGSEETRAKIIKDYALLGLRNNKRSIDATGYKENPNGGKMTRQIGKKKTAKRTTKKKAARRATKKTTVKRSPAQTRYWAQVNYPKGKPPRYYDGARLTPNKSQAAFYTGISTNQSAGKKKVKINPTPLSSKARLNQAANLYESFTGHDAGYIDKINLPIAREVVRVGPCDGILYSTVRDGKPEKYIHKFKKSARPLLVSSFDGRTLYLIGGSYKFTERGIIDR